MRWFRCAALAAAISTVASAGCTEDPLEALDPETAPGVSNPTIEMEFDAAALPSWRDTTYWGFVTPGGAAFQISADSEDLTARPLGRFSNIPDSIFVDTTRVAIDSFDTAKFRVSFDTTLTTLPAGGIEVGVWGLTRAFDEDEVTWERAREGEPWTTPGGDLGTILALDTISLEADTLGFRPDTFVIPLRVDADSLLKAWRDADGEPGIALVTTGAGTEMWIRTVAVIAEAMAEGIDTTLKVVRSSSATTFIHDPPTPPPTTRLRLAGLPAARYYLDFELPDSVGSIALRGATINRAGLEFRLAARPQPPFAVERTGSAQAVRLLANPFVYGEKTPVGFALGLASTMDPDSLAEGSVVRYDISTLVRSWSAAPRDSVVPLRIGIVHAPENRQLGFWEFFSVEDPPGVRPVVRILFTPGASFVLP